MSRFGRPRRIAEIPVQGSKPSRHQSQKNFTVYYCYYITILYCIILYYIIFLSVWTEALVLHDAVHHAVGASA